MPGPVSSTGVPVSPSFAATGSEEFYTGADLFEEKPKTPNADEGKMWIEDTVFSYLLWNHGVEMWCDHDLSREIGHVGEFEYRLPLYAPSALALVEEAA